MLPNIDRHLSLAVYLLVPIAALSPMKAVDPALSDTLGDGNLFADALVWVDAQRCFADFSHGALMRYSIKLSTFNVCLTSCLISSLGALLLLTAIILALLK